MSSSRPLRGRSADANEPPAAPARFQDRVRTRDDRGRADAGAAASPNRGALRRRRAYDRAVRIPERFLGHVRASGLVPRRAAVLVACSGGADSVALLLLLHRLRRSLGIAKLVVAHLDHGLREGSRADAQFVAALARRLGLAVVVARRVVRRRPGESPEQAARRVRYRFLAESARAQACDAVATAHHMDDQAETVLFRVLRGAGVRGLRGIPAASRMGGMRVVRPLLPFRRASLRAWLVKEGQPWREDPSNAAGNDRARLRHEILPAIRSLLRRDPVPPLARLAAHAAEAQRSVPGIAPSGSAAEDRRRASASARRRRTSPPSSAVELTWSIEPVTTDLLLRRLSARPGSFEVLDADAVRGPLEVRRPRPGDRFHALGAAAPQRLGHYLQRRGVPAAERAAIRLLVDGEGILCVAGHGIAARGALGPESRRALVVTVSRSALVVTVVRSARGAPERDPSGESAPRARPGGVAR